MILLYFIGIGKICIGMKFIILFNWINFKYWEEGGDYKLVVYCGFLNKLVDLVVSMFFGIYLYDILWKNKRLVLV